MMIPVSLGLVIVMKQLEQHDRPAELPDLAIDPWDATRDGSTVTATVHNLGNGAANAIVVRLLDGERTIQEQTIGRLDAPVDFRPKRATATFSGVPSSRNLRIAIDPDKLLQLQRGEPVAFVSPVDAEKRGIVDGERVRFYNDVGEMEIQVKLTPPVKPGQVVCYHAWEPFQFKNGKSYQSLLPSPLNPIHLAGGYFHLQPMVMQQTPECTDRGNRVEMEKIV